jgi:hypothetical protein
MNTIRLLNKGDNMRNVYLISLALLLVSCGKKSETKYIENPYDNSGNDARLNDLENRVAAVESSIQSGISTMNALNSSIMTLESELDSLNDELDQSNADEAEALQDLIDTNTAAHNSMLALINSLQGQVNTNVTQLVTLQSQNTVVAYLDPCGDKPNTYDEIILKTSQGEFIAYFESGNQRFLTKLEKNVNYQTTDSQGCVFKIDTNGNLV